MAMGSSHSVRILMDISTNIVGRSLVASRRLGVMAPPIEALEENDAESRDELSENEAEELLEKPAFESATPLHSSDDKWSDRRASLNDHVRSGSHLKPVGWLKELRELMRESNRVLTVLHLFGGERRKLDVEHYVKRPTQQNGMKVHMSAVDLSVSPDWDLANPATFALLSFDL